MSKLRSSQKAYLQGQFGNRVNFNKTERILYGHDIAAMPDIIKPFIGDTVPEAVVQPISEDELVDLVRWASKNRIPLTPRGKASSGYGGVIPWKKGIVVDFYRMNRVLHIDTASNTARVQAGVIWEKLDRELAKKGLTLRLYPTSYPSSTAGGWFAQGGAGIGSFEAGWFRDNVLKARVVLPDGEVKEFSGDELDLISDAEGTTGFISELTVKVQPNDDMQVVSIGCADADDLQKFVQSVINEKLPIWSILFINPKMAELKNRSPLLMHYGHPAEERVLLPASYIATLTFRKKDAGDVVDRLPVLLKPCQGEILSDRIAQHEWANRYKLMVVKRLGPSLVPAEIVVPLSSLGAVMDEIEKKVDQPVVKEGVIIRESLNGKPEVVILGFIPSDQRKFSYNFVFSLALTIMNIAVRNGGRPYATGLYFAAKANDVLGTQRARKIRELKKKLDPRNIFNPGKVVGGNPLGSLIGMAEKLEPLIRPLGNSVITQVSERPLKAVKDIPADIAWYAYACSQCGYCVEECDQFYGRGWESQSPRGKWYWLREYMEGRQKWDQFMVDTMLVCTTCELCNLRCSASLPIEPSWMKLRGKLIDEEKRMTFPPFEMMAEATLKEGDIWAGYRRDRSRWFPEDLKAKHGAGVESKNVYFAGCTASYVEHDIGMASVKLLDEAGVDFTYLGEKENCCGTPMLVAGKWDVFAETMKHNIAAVKASGADSVITSCPACDMMWRHVYPAWAEKLGIDFGITVRHYSEVVADRLKSGQFKFPDRGKEPVKVTWHDSCHIGRVSHIYDEPRELIKALPGVEFVEMPYIREAAHCCGSVLTLIKDPPVAADIGECRISEAQEVGAEKILALCPCCEFQLRVSANKKKIDMEITDLARFCCSRMGFDFPDPNPEVRKQWAVFEAMIALMTPQGFANLMGKMWPELIDAMPFGMGPMMRFMGKIPGAFNLMKPIFPILFPLLLPMMMPKVMPKMLGLVGEMIPMPDYMSEQMPIMMPKVMDNLMPHMIGDVVPLVTPAMIDYLQDKSR
ncbi:MAG: FAD-binding and (Fe-S)-binding domain-containing protein [Dehalococcoidia bacterium]|jgi:Fe-S oxidoreductase/FAD/FMN-containing dehydrogenase